MEFRRDFIQLSTSIHQVVLLRAEFEPPKIVSAVGLAAPGGLTLGSAPYFWLVEQPITYKLAELTFKLKDNSANLYVMRCSTSMHLYWIYLRPRMLNFTPYWGAGESIGGTRPQQGYR